MNKEFDNIIREYFDITDNNTRKILVNVSEADRGEILSSLTHKLYDNIVEKVDDIDFGSIPMTKGDITKLDEYHKLVDCTNTIKALILEYKQDTTNNIDIIIEAMHNIESRKDLFRRSYDMNLELPMVLYSTITLAIVSSVSLMITTCIEFIKNPGDNGFDVELDKVSLLKSKENLLFNNLNKFNESCKKGQIDSSIEFIIKNKVKSFTGYEIGLVMGGLAIIGIILNIIPVIRELIFFFYYSRVRVSDYFDIQADLLQMNAHSFELNKNDNIEDKKKIINKQMKLVDMFRKISNKIGINNKQAEVKSTKEINEKSKDKLKYSDISDSLPDSVSSSIF